MKKSRIDNENSVEWYGKLIRIADDFSLWIQNNRNFYYAYTVLFIILSILIYSIFPLYSKTMIWISSGGDGWTQYLKRYVFTGRWLRNIVDAIISGKGFDGGSYALGVGYGMGANSFLYIGDPLIWLSIFVPSKYVMELYAFLRLLRLYLAGIAFVVYCVYMGNKSKGGLLCGAFLYIFSEYGLVSTAKHPQFGNFLILFPLILLGIEKILRENKTGVYYVFVTISLAYSLYYCYMFGVLCLIYFFFRITYFYSTIKAVFTCLCRFIVITILCILSSGILMVPYFILLYNSPRVTKSYVFEWIYSINYYLNYFNTFISNTRDYGKVGMGGFPLLAIILLFLYTNKKEGRTLKIFFVIGNIFLLFPFFAQMLNGFSYAANRWLFAFAMLISYIFVFEWSNLVSISKKNVFQIIGVLIAYVIVGNISVIFSYFAFNLNTYFQLFLVLITITLIVLLPDKKQINALIMGIAILVSIITNSFYCFSPAGYKYISQFLSQDNNLSAKLFDTESRQLRKIENNTTLFRYTGNSLTKNGGVLDGLSSTDFFASLADPIILELFRDYALPNNNPEIYSDLDDRTILNELADVKYYVSNNARFIPYGFSRKTSIKRDEQNLDVYQNAFALPIGYTYSSWFSRDIFDKLTYPQRQEAILRSAMLDNNKYTATTNIENFKNSSYELPFSLNTSKGIIVEEKNIVVTKENASIVLEFEGSTIGETYLYLGGMDYRDTRPDIDINNQSFLCWLRDLMKTSNWKERQNVKLTIQGTTESVKNKTKYLTYLTNENIYYTGRHDFLVNLGYSEEPMNTITITFPSTGIYTFKKLSVVCQPMDHYAEDVAALKEDVLEDVDLHNQNRAGTTSLITGKISLDKPKILCISLPYNAGWSAKVDGVETEILKVNTAFMGLALEPGDHEIELRYRTPGRREGAVMSVIGIIGFLILLVYDRKRQAKTEVSFVKQ